MLKEPISRPMATKGSRVDIVGLCPLSVALKVRRANWLYVTAISAQPMDEVTFGPGEAGT